MTNNTVADYKQYSKVFKGHVPAFIIQNVNSKKVVNSK